MSILVGLYSIFILFYGKVDAMDRNVESSARTAMVNWCEIKKEDFFQKLDHAIGNNDFDMAKSLLASGVNSNISDLKTGLTPLMIASKKGDERLVKLLINVGAEINLLSKLGCSALSLAAGGNHHNIVQMLMDAGANAHLMNQNGDTPLSMTTYCYENLDKTPQEKAKSIDTIRILRKEKPLSRTTTVSHFRSCIRAFFKRNKKNKN